MNQAMTYLALLAVFAMLCVVSRLILNRWSSSDSDDDLAALAGEGNMAVALRHGSFYIALGIALFATIGLEGRPTDFIGMLLEELAWGIGILIALFGCLYVNEKLVLPSVDNSTAIGEGNVAVGVVEAGSLLGTSLIMTGTMHGTGPIAATVVFFLIGQFLMLAMVRLYDMLRSVDYQKEVGLMGNQAAGIVLFGKIVAISLVIRNAISGNSSGWVSDLTGSLLSFLAGFIALAIVEYLVDKAIFPGADIDKLVSARKAAPMVILSSISIATALFVTAVSPY